MRQQIAGSEAQEQEILFHWACGQMDRMPELEFMYHIPNGGKRDKGTAAKLYRQGVKAGVPDIHLPVPRNGYHGLYIELKVRKNKTTDNQDRWIAFLQSQGYMTVICYGWQQAAETIESYLLHDD